MSDLLVTIFVLMIYVVPWIICLALLISLIRFLWRKGSK